MRKSAVCVVALGVAAAVAVSGCSPKKSSKKASGPEVGVILPDTTTSHRYTLYDAPLLTKAFAAAGVKADIQNARARTPSSSAIAQIDDLRGREGPADRPGRSGHRHQRRAGREDAGIKVIDYDRVNLGGSAEYYVSFDNEAVGKLQAQTLVELPERQGREERDRSSSSTAAPTSTTTRCCSRPGRTLGARPAVRRGNTRRRVPRSTSRAGSNDVAATDFQQALTQTGGKVDGVLAANDGIAGVGDRRAQEQEALHRPGHRAGRDRLRSAVHPAGPAVHDGLQGRRARRRTPRPSWRSRWSRATRRPPRRWRPEA